MTTSTFEPALAQAMIALCANINGASGIGPLTPPAIPGQWQCIYNQSLQTFGMFGNTWQLWQNGTTAQYAIVIQGTQPNAASMIEDVVFPMIRMQLSIGPFSIALPQTAGSGAHAGFVYGAVVMLVDMLTQLTKLKLGNADAPLVIITGHSMGAAIATITTSLIQQLAESKLASLLGIKGVPFQTYVFAQPRPGDDGFANEINLGFTNAGSFYRAVSNQDWVPQAPLTLEGFGTLNSPNPVGTVIQPWIAQHLPDVSAVVSELETKAADLLRELDGYLNTKLQDELEAFVSSLSTMEKLLLGKVTGSIEVVPRLDFTSSGAPITIAATPGTNPSDPSDFMWQHHASQYYWNLSKQYGLATEPRQQS